MAGKYGRLIGNRVFEKTPRAVCSDDRDSHVEMKEWQQRERAQAREQLQRPPADRSSPRELVWSCIVQDRAARAGLCAYSGGAKFAPHLNSHSQPSAKLVVLFPNTGDSLDAAFVKKKSVRHVSPPR